MDYRFKITTHGRAVLAACADLGKGLKLTRAAVGSGMIDADEDLAKMHGLIRYVAEATIADRRHEEDRLYLTVRYSNKDRNDIGMFTLSEFMVWAEDPETGQETDFLYATLGDFRQPVPACSENFPASVWSYPLVLAVSGDLAVYITASPGLVTWDDLLDMRVGILRAIMTGEVSLPLLTAAGKELLTSAGTPIHARYRLERSGTVMEDAEAEIRQSAAALRAYADSAKQAAIAAAGADAAARVKAASDTLSAQITRDIAAHNGAEAAHPTHLAVVTK